MAVWAAALVLGVAGWVRAGGGEGAGAEMDAVKAQIKEVKQELHELRKQVAAAEKALLKESQDLQALKQQKDEAMKAFNAAVEAAVAEGEGAAEQQAVEAAKARVTEIHVKIKKAKEAGEDTAALQEEYKAARKAVHEAMKELRPHQKAAAQTDEVKALKEAYHQAAQAFKDALAGAVAQAGGEGAAAQQRMAELDQKLKELYQQKHGGGKKDAAKAKKK
jgi:electron transport complex protein RnfC